MNLNESTVFNLDDEVRKFTLNDYVKKTSNLQYLEKTEVNDKDYEYNDMLLTNEYNDNPIADTYDKSRYSELRTKYIEINSKARNSSFKTHSGNEQSALFSTGSNFVTEYDFYVFYASVNGIAIDAINNRINIVLRTYINNDMYNEITFSVLIRIGEYTLPTLKIEMQAAFDIHMPGAFTIFLEEDIFDPTNIKFTLSSSSTGKFTAKFPHCSNAQSAQSTQNLLYKSPSHYRLYLNTLYRNVKTIRLISSHFINTCTIINNSNNIIKYSIENHSSYSESDQIEIPIGNYTPSALATYIVDTLNFEIFGLYQITNYMSWTITNDRIRFVTEVDHFSLHFTGNLWEMLGLDSICTNGYVDQLIGSFDIDLRKAEYIWLDINGFNTVYDTLSEKSYFNKVVFIDNKHSEQQTSGSDLLFYPVCTIIDINYNLSYIDVNLFDAYGLPYVTTKDHWFTLEIVYPEDRLIGTNIQTSRDEYKQPIAQSIF